MNSTLETATTTLQPTTAAVAIPAQSELLTKSTTTKKPTKFLHIFITIVIIIISILCLYYMYIYTKRSNIKTIVNDAVNRSQFHPTVFKIYDKSTADICNRLIIIEPFNWYVWAIRGELYILNPESGIRCTANSMPAVRVYSAQFVETCLKINMNAIYLSYVNGKLPVIVPYEIETQTFTILSALNILVKDLITFDAFIEDTDKFHHFATVDDYNEYEMKRQKLMPGRVISGKTLINVMEPAKKRHNHTHLQKQYSKHTSGNHHHYNHHHDHNDIKQSEDDIKSRAQKYKAFKQLYATDNEL